MNVRAVVTEAAGGRLLNHVELGRHRMLADEPVALGGSEAGPGPYDLLAAALGACTSMTLRMYAERKQFPLDRVTVQVAHDRVREPGEQEVDVFTRVIRVDGDLDESQRAALLTIAQRCPVHRTLERSSRIDTSLA